MITFIRKSLINFSSRIKLFIKESLFWRIWISSWLYYEIKNPPYYRRYKKQYNFYKKVLRLHENSTDLIFDVGANVGSKSDIFSRLAKQVIAFEPSPSLFLLLKNKFKNRNVQILNLALG